MITIKNTLAEVVRDYPQSIPFFNELHLDYCCGEGIPLEEAVKGPIWMHQKWWPI